MMAIKIGFGDGLYLLNPKADITPLESARLAEFLVNVTTYTNSLCGAPTSEDRREFCEAHNLMRHFDKEVL